MESPTSGKAVHSPEGRLRKARCIAKCPFTNGGISGMFTPYPKRLGVRLTLPSSVCVWGGTHVELTIYWSPTGRQTVLALIDPGVGYTLIYGKPSKFWGENEAVNSYGGEVIKVRQISLYLQMGRFPPCCFLVHISLIPEYILGGEVYTIWI